MGEPNVRRGGCCAVAASMLMSFPLTRSPRTVRDRFASLGGSRARANTTSPVVLALVERPVDVNHPKCLQSCSTAWSHTRGVFRTRHQPALLECRSTALRGRVDGRRSAGDCLQLRQGSHPAHIPHEVAGRRRRLPAIPASLRMKRLLSRVIPACPGSARKTDLSFASRRSHLINRSSQPFENACRRACRSGRWFIAVT
jgi:hypothetical protein